LPSSVFSRCSWRWSWAPLSATPMRSLRRKSPNSKSWRRALLVAQALAEYGPEAKPARNLMKQALSQSCDLFWRGADVRDAQHRNISL
jgi:hypothetical protein